MTKWFTANLRDLSSNESYMFSLSKDNANFTLFLTSGWCSRKETLLKCLAIPSTFHKEENQNWQVEINKYPQ